MDDGWTPLLVASWADHLEVVWELLARGAAVDAALNNGATPLFIASEGATWRLLGRFLRGAPWWR